jgi:hypothetical protein
VPQLPLILYGACLVCCPFVHTRVSMAMMKNDGRCSAACRRQNRRCAENDVYLPPCFQRDIQRIGGGAHGIRDGPGIELLVAGNRK